MTVTPPFGAACLFSGKVDRVNAAPTIPADGPDAALGRVASRLRLPFAQAQIVRWVAAHPRPSSLLALVDVAGALDLKVTPGKTEQAELANVRHPAIVHFNVEGGGGFGVLEGTTPEGFEVWDSVGGSRVMDRDTFARHWSGIVVLIEAPVSVGATKTSYLRNRVGSLIAGGERPATVAGGPGATSIRVALGLLMIVLLALALLARPDELRVGTGAFAVLSILGVVVTTVMSVAISDFRGPFSPGICRRGRFIDCQSVLTSRFAKIMGFPLSDLGIAFYGAILLLLATAGVARDAAPVAVVGAAFIATVPVAIVLIGVQLFMRRLCTLCLVVHAVNIVGAGIASLVVFDEIPLFLAKTVPSALFFLLLFCLVLFFVVPYLKTHDAFSRLSLTHGRMSASPFASLAQLVTERPTDLVGLELGIQLAETLAPDELVLFIHPSCNQCEPVLREVRSLASNGRAKVFATIAPLGDGDRHLCETVIAIGLSEGPEALARGYSIAKSRFKELVATDPVPVLSGELDVPIDDHVREGAATMVRRAERFAAEHVEGTPAIFFNSLPYRGPLAHLVTLLTDHPDLLPRATQAQPQP